MLQYLCNFEQTLFTGVTTSRFNQLSFILTRIDFVSVLSKTFFFSLKAQNTANAENLFVYFNNLVLSISKLSSQDGFKLYLLMQTVPGSLLRKISFQYKVYNAISFTQRVFSYHIKSSQKKSRNRTYT